MAELSNWLINYPLLTYAGVILFGLLIGSFLNVVIYRLPVMLQREWQQECAVLTNQPVTPQPTFNLSRPRSRCSQCQQQLSALDNIPLLSWCVLRGRCRYCHSAISARYPLIELISGLLSVLALWQFGATPQLLGALLVCWLLLAMTAIDIDHLLLPDILTLSLLWLGLLFNLNAFFMPLFDAVLGAAIGYGILWSLYWLFKLATGKEGMGYGDFKLLAALGAWFGWQSLLPILLIASIAGSLIGLALMASRKLNNERALPFGPALALGGIIYLFWGQQLVDWYWSIAL